MRYADQKTTNQNQKDKSKEKQIIEDNKQTTPYITIQ